MAKSRSTPGRSVRRAEARGGPRGRYDSERVASGARREIGLGENDREEYGRGSNGGRRSQSYDGEEERDPNSFMSRMGRTFSEMDFEKAMVLLNIALAVAVVIKQSKDKDRGRKGQPLRSAVSILNHYLNEGEELTESQRASLADIRQDLRKLYEREEEKSYSPSGG